MTTALTQPITSPGASRQHHFPGNYMACTCSLGDEVLCPAADYDPSPAGGPGRAALARGCVRPPETAQLSASVSRAVAPRASCQRLLPVPAPAAADGPRLWTALSPAHTRLLSLLLSLLLSIWEFPCGSNEKPLCHIEKLPVMAAGNKIWSLLGGDSGSFELGVRTGWLESSLRCQASSLKHNEMLPGGALPDGAKQTHTRPCQAPRPTRTVSGPHLSPAHLPGVSGLPSG